MTRRPAQPLEQTGGSPPAPQRLVDGVPPPLAGALLAGVLLLGAGGTVWQHFHPDRAPETPVSVPASSSAVLHRSAPPSTGAGADAQAPALPTAARAAAARFAIAYGSRRWDQPPRTWIAGLASTVTPRLLDQLESGSSGAAAAAGMAAAHQVDTVRLDAIVPAAGGAGDGPLAAVTYTVTATPTTPATVTAGRFTLTVTLVNDDGGRWRADALSV